MTRTTLKQFKKEMMKKKGFKQAYAMELVKDLLVTLAYQVRNLTLQGKNGKVNAKDWSDEFIKIFNRLKEL